jgi:hemoglobin
MSIEPGPPQTLYDAIGGEPTFRKLIGRFYELVEVDEVLRPLYPEEDLGPAEERLRLFFMQYWGGPQDYAELRGHPRLGMRHFPFKIGLTARNAWLRAMTIALDESGIEDDYRRLMWNHMETVAINMTTHKG